jgi:alkyldihydroxyacetonephosphate synthase
MSDGAGANGVESRWWGWGDPGKRVELGPDAVEMLRAQLGPAEPGERVEIEQVAMPEPRPLPDAVVKAAGGSVLTSREHRVRRAAGSNYPDLIRLRTGRLEDAPDAVVMPSGEEEVASILAACAEAGVAVVPFGGGTSVVGGVTPLRAGFDSVLSLDLRRMRHVEIDPVSMIARLGPGLRGPEAEQALAAEGFTLGHFPQSFEYATIGGFAATRSAGQASSGYGRFDALVTSISMLAPTGKLRTLETPHTAAGPALRELMVGSEGVLGVITDVAVRIRPAPQTVRYEGWFAKSFEDAREAVRTLAQSGALPEVIRVSDERETAVSFGLAGAPGATRRALDAYLRLRGVAGGCLVICGWEGDEADVGRRRTRSARQLRGSGLVGLGAAPGRAWHRGRYDGPYLRDELLDRGYMVETLETAHTWSRLDELYRAVGGAISSALDAAGTPGIVMCHLSHAYPDGASLYFTFIAARRPGEEIEHWRRVKTAACQAITEAGGTITHHHAIGRDHAPYMPAEVGDLGLGALRALKDRLDPAGIMNPGKLLPDQTP